MYLGAKVSGASPAYNVDEMAYAMKTADSKFLFTAPSSMEVATGAAQQSGLPKSSLFLLEGQMEGYSTIHDLIAIGKNYGEAGQIPSYKIPAGKKNKDICGYLSFSSGTTGLPKAV
jgi:4-coumarate--CoA ligase